MVYVIYGHFYHGGWIAKLAAFSGRMHRFSMAEMTDGHEQILHFTSRWADRLYISVMAEATNFKLDT